MHPLHTPSAHPHHGDATNCPTPATNTAASLAAPPAGQGEGIHPEKTGCDKMRDSRFVLAKGAGPGIYNRWISHVGGFRVFWPHVHADYLA